MNKQELTKPIVSIDSIPAGTMICAIQEINGLEKLVFIIKEDQFHLRLIPDYNPSIELRSGFIKLDGVGLTTILIQIAHNPSLTYRCWFNYFDSDGIAKECIKALATQEELYLLFIKNSTKSVKHFIRNNDVTIAYWSYIQQLQNMVPWSAQDFEYAQSKILRPCPFPIDLWHGLKILGERK